MGSNPHQLEGFPAGRSCGECECEIALAVKHIYEVSTSVEQIRPDLTRLTSRLFDCIANLVKTRKIANENDLGFALGAVFDLSVSLLYAEQATHTRWLYCPNEPAMSFYTYVKSCPRCGQIGGETEIPHHKPPSDRIGRYTSYCLAAIIAEMCRRTKSGWRVRLVPQRDSEVDAILTDGSHLVLCEIKASPLTAFPLSTVYEEPLTEDASEALRLVSTHRATDVPEWARRELGLFLFASNQRIPVRARQSGSSGYTFLESLLHRKRAKLVEEIHTVVEVWKSMMHGYASRWEQYPNLRWFTFGCGGGVDDSKNAPGLDRTDDIKKGLYQSLKLSESYRMKCARRMIRIALLSNIHPAVHYEDYLQGFEGAVWTYESKLQSDHLSSEWMKVRQEDLSPFYDAILTLTKSWFRAKELEQAFGLGRLYEALGGRR